MLRYSVSYYEKVADYWMQLRKGEEPFKTRKEAEEFKRIVQACLTSSLIAKFKMFMTSI